MEQKTKGLDFYNFRHYYKNLYDKFKLQNSEITNEIVVIFLIKKLVITEEYQILCLLLPELEEILNCHLKSSNKFIDKKIVHFILGSIFYKFFFLKENIKKEITENMTTHTDYWINSPILLSFVTGMQSFLISTIAYAFDKQKRDLILPILMLKTFLNFISIQSFFYPTTDHYLSISFIDDLSHCNFGEENLKINLKKKNNIYLLELTEGFIDQDIIENLSDLDKVLKKIFSPNNLEGIEEIKQRLRLKILKIKEYFLKTEIKE